MMKCYKNIETEAVMIDIKPPMCRAYWKEITFHEFLEAVGEIKDYVLYCEAQEEPEEEPEEENDSNPWALTEEEEIAYNKYDDERGAQDLQTPTHRRTVATLCGI